ncbi:MAG: hypothetical protein ACOVN2_06370, partial [Usitatibacteraceae bacterium]
QLFAPDLALSDAAPGGLIVSPGPLAGTLFLAGGATRPAQFGAFRSDQMGIDATIKIPERFTEYPEVSKADPEQVAAIARKLAGIV